LEEDADTSLSIDDEFNLGGSTDCSGGVCDGSGGQ
jgi:hypothetical protein